MTTAVRTLADDLQDEIRRVRDQVMPAYIQIGPSGCVALALMRKDMDVAINALAQHNATECLRMLEVLRGYHT